MFNKTNFLIVGIVIAFGILLYFLASSFKTVEITLNGHKLKAEVVSSEGDMQKGLGERKKMCSSCAMLFDFKKKGRYGFWMKGMNFPLDIIWIKDGEIVHIEKNISEKFPGTLSSQVDANQVLEVNAGVSDKLGIRVGDKINF